MAAKKTFVDKLYDWLDENPDPQEVRDTAETLASAVRLRKYPFRLEIKAVEEKAPKPKKEE